MQAETIPSIPKYGLVLSGGGIRFATHAGILGEMERWSDAGEPWLKKFRVLVGTSAGSLYAALLAVGYSAGHIAKLAPIFSDERLSPALFDWNYGKAASAFLKHNVAYVLGLTEGHGVLTLLETLLKRGMAQAITGMYPDPTKDDTAAWDAVIRHIEKEWKARRTAARDANYFKDQLTFAECERELYIIGVNAYTGQKIVFSKLPSPVPGWDELDAKLFKGSTPEYINQQTWDAELKQLQQQLVRDEPFKYPRFENRVYHEFNPGLYSAADEANPQLPIALAVRASVSLPGFFEPARVQRRGRVQSKQERRQARTKSSQSRDDTAPSSKQVQYQEDLFLDGGVDDVFSLSVAADPVLGACTDILGISLGNWGYRFPDVNTTSSIVTVLLNTTNYLGDAVQDLHIRNSRLAACTITVINARTEIGAMLTDTDELGNLRNEARGIAQEFWRETHQAPYPEKGPVEIERSNIFAPAKGIRVYVSRGARVGTYAFDALLDGVTVLVPPRLADVLTQLPNLVVSALNTKKPDVETQAREVLQKPNSGQARGWLIFYAVLAVLLFGAVSFIMDLVELAFGILRYGWLWLGLRLGIVIALLLVLRLLAFFLSTRTVKDESVPAQ